MDLHLLTFTLSFFDDGPANAHPREKYWFQIPLRYHVFTTYDSIFEIFTTAYTHQGVEIKMSEYLFDLMNLRSHLNIGSDDSIAFIRVSNQFAVEPGTFVEVPLADIWSTFSRLLYEFKNIITFENNGSMLLDYDWCFQANQASVQGGIGMVFENIRRSVILDRGWYVDDRELDPNNPEPFHKIKRTIRSVHPNILRNLGLPMYIGDVPYNRNRGVKPHWVEEILNMNGLTCFNDVPYPPVSEFAQLGIAAPSVVPLSYKRLDSRTMVDHVTGTIIRALPRGAIQAPPPVYIPPGADQFVAVVDRNEARDPNYNPNDDDDDNARPVVAVAQRGRRRGGPRQRPYTHPRPVQHLRAARARPRLLGGPPPPPVTGAPAVLPIPPPIIPPIAPIPPAAAAANAPGFFNRIARPIVNAYNATNRFMNNHPIIRFLFRPWG